MDTCKTLRLRYNSLGVRATCPPPVPNCLLSCKRPSLMDTGATISIVAKRILPRGVLKNTMPTAAIHMGDGHVVHSCEDCEVDVPMGSRSIAHKLYVMDIEALNFVLGTNFFAEHPQVLSLTLQAPYVLHVAPTYACLPRHIRTQNTTSLFPTERPCQKSAGKVISQPYLQSFRTIRIMRDLLREPDSSAWSSLGRLAPCSCCP